MQNECIAMLKEGVWWDDVHLHAHQVAIDGLLSLGILKGNRKEILEARTSAAFLPHGLGHYLGMDTHDTGGGPNYADPDIMFRYLRVRKHLPAGSVVTVEPGVCGFIYLLERMETDAKGRSTFASLSFARLSMILSTPSISTKMCLTTTGTLVV